MYVKGYTARLVWYNLSFQVALYQVSGISINTYGKSYIVMNRRCSLSLSSLHPVIGAVGMGTLQGTESSVDARAWFFLSMVNVLAGT